MRQLDPRLAALLQVRSPRPRVLGQQADLQAPEVADALAAARDAIATAHAVDTGSASAGAQPQRPGPPQGARPSGSRGFRIFDAVLGEGLTITQARDRENAREAAVQEAARRRAIVQQAFPDDPVAQIAAEANWEEFGKNLAENYGVDIAAGGSTILSRGQRSVAPRVDQFSDRAGVTTVDAQGNPTTRYGAPRSPTFEELSQDRGRNTVNVAPGTEVVDLGGTPPGAVAQAASGDLWSRLVRHESGGDQSAVSPKGAFGRAQLMPTTAAYIAQQMGDPSLAERARTDPSVNEAMGRWYLNQQLERFGGNEAVALAAYNAGPEKAAEWVQRYGMPQPGQEAAWAAQIPYPETRQYVTSILGLNQPQAAPRPGPGGARVLAANPKPQEAQVRFATPEDVAARGLQGNYQILPSGEWKRLDEGKPQRGQVDPAARQEQAQRVLSTIDSALKLVGPMTTGFIGGNTRRIAGTDAYNLARQVETIKANLAFDQLAAMRAASPTGGALGAVSEKELALLESAVANLDTAQSEGQLRANLAAIRQHYQAWQRTVQPQAAPRPGPPAANPQAAQAGLAAVQANERRFRELAARDRNRGWTAEEVR